MSEMGGLDIGMPDEGAGGASEEAREQAAQRFAALQAALQQLQKEEKKSKKRDDNVAQVILQFLTDTQKTHLATLIARLVALNCPSVFILAILSLINDRCTAVVEEYLREHNVDPASAAPDQSIIPTNSALSDEANARLATWITRTNAVMHIDEENVLNALILDDQNIDGTILQLTTFVLQEFLVSQNKHPAFEHLQQLSAGILQSLFQPYMHARMGRRMASGSDEHTD